MYILKHVLPLVILSIGVGFIAARLDFSQLTGTFEPSQQKATQLEQVEPGLQPRTPTPRVMNKIAEPETVLQIEPPVEAESTDTYMEQIDPDASDEGWSADHFLDIIHNDKGAVEADSRVDGPVAAAIAKAAKRTEARANQDPYLSSLLDEASDLSVTVVVAIPGAGLVRNDPNGLADRFLIVEQGESLSEIANRVYGDPKAYQRIFNANRDVLTNPDMVSTGQQLRIPGNTAKPDRVEPESSEDAAEGSAPGVVPGDGIIDP